jgi:spore maturation protein CgeB
VRIVLFVHSLVSDWNHGNAHFLRGVARELLDRGHDMEVFEPEDSWSFRNLLRVEGRAALHGFRRAYPGLDSRRYRLADLDLDEALDGADLVLVHEWNDPALVRSIALHRRSQRYRLLFHDTHHRSVTASGFIDSLRLDLFDGVLVFGASLEDHYRRRGWSERIWVWHEAADTQIFRPVSDSSLAGDLVWIGNWGDGERTAELEEFLVRPVSALGLRAVAYGVRYPPEVHEDLERRGIRYVGWLPNYRVPEVFARFQMTVHIPRGPYRSLLPGIPTIRVFEALACGIPLICSPWDDVEGLFHAGEDYLVARNRSEMTAWIRCLLADEDARRELSENGRRVILERHTCIHRVDQLLGIAEELGIAGAADEPLSMARKAATSGEEQTASQYRPNLNSGITSDW